VRRDPDERGTHLERNEKRAGRRLPAWFPSSFKGMDARRTRRRQMVWEAAAAGEKAAAHD